MVERDIGHSILAEGRSADRKPLWLDELDPSRGDGAGKPDMDCSIICLAAEATYAASSSLAEGDSSTSAR